MNASNTNRMGHVDAIRGIAALLVAYLHISHDFVTWSTIKPRGTYLYDIAFQLDFGQVGVIAFFAISGFVICPTLKGQLFQGARKFVISRFFRLFPAFWISIVLALLINVTWLGKTIDIPQVLGNIPMLYSAFRVEPLMGLYWTLEVELIFYFLSLTLFLCGWLHKPLILFSVGMGLIAAHYWIGGRQDIWNTMDNALGGQGPLLPLNLCIMLWGGLFRIWYDDRQRTCFLGSISIPVAALIIVLLFAILSQPFILLCTWIVQGNFWALHKIIQYFLGLGLFITGVLYIKLNNRFLVWLGTISYSLYLLHPLTFLVLRPLIDTKFPNWAGLHLSVYLVACILLSILLAGFVYHCIEKPAINLGRYLQNR